MLRATTPCTFSTSQLPKVLRDRQFLTLFTSKCASRHNAVHFFDISTSKSAPRPTVFNTFYFPMCLSMHRFIRHVLSPPVLSIYLLTCRSICLAATSTTKQCCWQHQKRSNSARLSHFLQLKTSKTKQFCETSFKNGKLTVQLKASYQFVLRFFHAMSLKYCACHEKVNPGHTKCCIADDLIRQNATPLRKSAP